MFVGGLICENGGKLIKDIAAGAPGVEDPDCRTASRRSPRPCSRLARPPRACTVSVAGLPNTALKGAGAAFVKEFTKADKRAPDPYSVYAAQAAEAMVAAIAQSNGTRVGRRRSSCSRSTEEQHPRQPVVQRERRRDVEPGHDLQDQGWQVDDLQGHRAAEHARQVRVAGTPRTRMTTREGESPPSFSLYARTRWPPQPDRMPSSSGAAARGEAAAWNELVERFSRYVFAICTQGFRLAEHDAEDVFQDVFTRVYTHLDRLRDDEALPALARAADAARRASTSFAPAAARRRWTSSSRPSSTRRCRSSTRRSTVHDAHGALPENCREILDRFFAQDESYRTIGEALELPGGHGREPDLALPRQIEGRRWKKTPSPPVLKPGDSMNAYDHDALARLIAALPPAPRGWVRAAQELPAARRGSTASSSGPQRTPPTGNACRR